MLGQILQRVREGQLGSDVEPYDIDFDTLYCASVSLRVSFRTARCEFHESVDL